MSATSKERKKGTPGQVKSRDRKRRRQKERYEQLKQQALQAGITVEQYVWSLQRKTQEELKEARNRPVVLRPQGRVTFDWR